MKNVNSFQIVFYAADCVAFGLDSGLDAGLNVDNVVCVDNSVDINCFDDNSVNDDDCFNDDSVYDSVYDDLVDDCFDDRAAKFRLVCVDLL
jgi:hypothetical protein